MSSVTLKNVVKKFGAVRAVNDLSLDIQHGEFAVLVGSSGCGKTTALRMIAGLEEASSDDILIGDQRVNDLPPKDRDIAMVLQNHALYPHTCATSRSTRQAILKKRRISPTAARSTWRPSSRRTTTPALSATCGPTMAAWIWGEKVKAGYGLYDRALGAVYLNGLWEAIDQFASQPAD